MRDPILIHAQRKWHDRSVRRAEKRRRRTLSAQDFPFTSAPRGAQTRPTPCRWSENLDEDARSATFGVRQNATWGISDYFAASLIDQIIATPRQEIATHTFSHFHTLEPGATTEAFAADLEAARTVAARRGVTLRSIVFPRNQYGEAQMDICRAAGITAWRGNPDSWAYRATAGGGQTLARRGFRLLDAYSGILGAQTYAPETSAFRNVPASQFLRPKVGRLEWLHPAHLGTILRGMTLAAQTGRGYHLWWHPHNFGVNTAENMAALRHIVSHFRSLHDDHGMVSRAMGQVT